MWDAEGMNGSEKLTRVPWRNAGGKSEHVDEQEDDSGGPTRRRKPSYRFYPGEEKLIKTKPAILVCQKLGFFGRESPCGIERQTVCSHAVHAKDPCAGKKCDDVDAYRRHVAVVVGD